MTISASNNNTSHNQGNHGIIAASLMEPDFLSPSFRISTNNQVQLLPRYLFTLNAEDEYEDFKSTLERFEPTAEMSTVLRYDETLKQYIEEVFGDHLHLFPTNGIISKIGTNFWVVEFAEEQKPTHKYIIEDTGIELRMYLQQTEWYLDTENDIAGDPSNLRNLLVKLDLSVLIEMISQGHYSL